MRPDAQPISTTLYVLYDGDGDYFVELKSFHQLVEVKIPIAKPKETE